MFTANSPEDKLAVVGTLLAVLLLFGLITLAIWHPFIRYLAGLKKLECTAINSNAIKC
jgi:fumarate reductase subunit D